MYSENILKLLCGLSYLWRFKGLPIAEKMFSGCPSPTFLERRIFGYRFQMDVSRSNIQKLLFLEGERCIEERNLVRTLVCGKKCLVDVGANIGYYLLLFQKFVDKDACIHCIEPSAENLPELERTILLNRFSNVSLHKVAVGDKEGVVGLRQGINSGVSEKGTAEYEVSVTLLDKLIEDPVDFLKIDVEGYEFHVLQGSEKIIRKHRPVLFLELHPQALNRFGASVQDCLDFLMKYYNQIDFYGGLNSIGLKRSKAKRFVDRTAGLYLGANQVRKIILVRDELKRIDSDHPWGTFWVVCHSG